jgi:Bacterial cellulose synthase subunit
MKSKFLLSVAAMLFCAMQVFAQGDNRSFKSMGYDDASITGVSGSLSFFIKVRPDDNIDQSKLVLNLRASQVLNPQNSFVVVYMKDEPVYTQRVIASALDTLLRFEIPLSSKYLQPDGRFIKMRVATKMSIGDEYCKDIDNPACWVVVRNSSYIASTTQGSMAYQRSIKEIIQDYSSVYTPQTSNEDDLMAGGLLYAILRQSASSKEVYTAVYNANDTVPGGIIAGVADKLPFAVKNAMPAVSSGQGLIALVPVNTGLGNRFVLVVTGGDAAGYKKAINVLASNKRLSSAFTEKLLISDAAPSSISVDNPSPLITSLEDLGGDAGLLEGIGAMRKKYTFSLSEFNAIPNKLTFHIESFFSTLKAEDRGFINIFLNQNLVYNASLLDKPNFIGDVDLKPYLLSKFNTLEVEFRFHPGANVCKDGFSNFFAFINTKSSTLTFAGERENKFYSFFNFPAEFRKTPTKIVVSQGLMSQNIVSSIGEIYYQLNSPIKNDFNKLIVPQVVSSSSASDLSGYNAIALVQRGDAFATKYKSMPVNFNKDFQIYKDLKGAMSYSVNDFSNSGLAQIFRENGSTILMVTALGDSSAKNAYLSVIKNFSTQLTEIESNVCVANSNGMSNYFFKAPEDNSEVSYKGDMGGLERFWNNYKFVVLGILLIAILAGLFFVKNRVKEATNSVI